MPRGPKPKPVELRSPNHQRIEPVVIGGKPRQAPEPPSYLNDDGRRFWDEAVPCLHELGLLDTVDRPALEMAAVAYQRFHEARRVIAKHGVMARGSVNQVIEHPMLGTERKSQVTFLRFAEQYGLTSAARARLGIAMLQGESLQRSLTAELGETEFQPAT